MAKNFLILSMFTTAFLIGCYFGNKSSSVECYKIGFELGSVMGISDKIIEYKTINK